jgi:histidinol dehydrogenase
MQPFRTKSPEAEAALRELEERRNAAHENAWRVAGEMIEGVRARGDAFVAEQVLRFDGVEQPLLAILPGAGRQECLSHTFQAIDAAIARVESFHLQQAPLPYRWTSGGTEVLHRVKPLARAGIYVPGGRAVYVSTLIMCAVPARIAGVRELVVATTPAAAATPELQYACAKLGVRELYRAGGAAAIAAMALGTESLRRVDKIAGPGNAYVTAAKARLVGEVGIDMTAGPTELVVIADDTADAALVQADLDAQQEHGADSAVILICIGKPLPDIRATLTLLADDVADAIAIADRIAPEHLSIHARDAASIAARAENCAAIYCGPYSPPAAGDYAVGSNHVLPTSGSARFFSPLGVYDFVKRSNVITLTKEALEEIAPTATALAYFEGLPQHAKSIEARTGVPA